jgi:phosphoglucosamine mutase
VKARGAALGLAFDGDGDRLITVDETGLVRDGDYFLAICARHLKSQGELPGGIVVSTIMANLGLERSLAEAGIRLVKTAVGDRYVLEEMRRLGATLGGEQSGHVIFLNRTSTGDGILSSLQLLRVMAETGKGLAALSQCLRKYPQVLVNVPVRSKPPIETIGGLATRIQDLEAAMEGRGRIFVRYSGTEPLARIMVEGEDQKAISAMVEELAEIVRREIG